MRQFSRLSVSSLRTSATPSQFLRTQRRGTAGSLLKLPSFTSCTPHARAFGRGVSSSVEPSIRRGVIGGQRRSNSTSSTSSTSKGTRIAARAGEGKDMATPTTTTAAAAAAAEEQPKCEWLVVLPDKPGVLEQRVRVRGQHIAAIASAYPSDFWLVAGALLERAPHEIAANSNSSSTEAAASATADAAPPPLPMQGSAGLVWASSTEEIRRLLSGDVYAREGVWDMEKLQCWAFKSAVRRVW